MNTSDTPARAADKKSKSAVPAVEKALDVLELLANSANGLTMNEIVDGLGRTMGEIYRVVIYLADRGYIRQDEASSRYALTLKLFELSHTHDPTERLIRHALPALEDISAATNQSCHLGVVNRNSVLVLASNPSPMPAGYAVRTGALFPIEMTSSGHVILAFSPEADQARYLATRPQAEQAELTQRLAKIRNDGFENTVSKMVDGVRNLCVPVFDSRGVVAAITTGFIGQVDQKASPDQTLRLIRLEALELSKSLGFQLVGSPFEPALTN